MKRSGPADIRLLRRPRSVMKGSLSGKTTETMNSLLAAGRPVRLAVVFGSLVLLAAAAFAQSTSILERGPHHQVVQTVSPDGSTNSFVELRTGLGRWSDADGGGWVLASLEIEKVNGVFLSRKTQYQAIFATNATASEGTIDLQMLNGARLRDQRGSGQESPGSKRAPTLREIAPVSLTQAPSRM